jgi:3-dehydroquinate dehydratase II
LGIAVARQRIYPRRQLTSAHARGNVRLQLQKEINGHLDLQTVMKVLLINGPNLNLLGTREPHIYGSTTLKDIEKAAAQQTSASGSELSAFQSNHEGAIIDRIHQAREEKVDYIVINPGAYTHTSIAIRDALAGVGIKFIEVHLTNIHARETFRHHSYLSDNAVAVICGLGTYGYGAAIGYILDKAT